MATSIPSPTTRLGGDLRGGFPGGGNLRGTRLTGGSPTVSPILNRMGRGAARGRGRTMRRSSR